MRLQIALEYMIIFAFVLVVFLFIFALIASQRAQTLSNQLFGQEQIAAQNIASQLQIAMQTGNGYTARIPLSSQIGELKYQLLIGRNGAVLINASVSTQNIQAIAYSGVQPVSSNPLYLQAGTFYYNLPTANGTLYIQNEFGSVCVDYQCPTASSSAANVSLTSQSVHAALLNGASSYIAASNVPSLSSQLTISAWANFASASGSQYLANIDTSGLGTSQIGIEYSNGNLYFYVSGASCYVSVSWTPVTATWYNIIATFNAGAYGLYINGSPVSVSQFGSCTDVAASGSYSYIGAEATNFLNGTIANVQVYDSAFSAAQARGAYASGIGAPLLLPANAVSWWPLNGNANDYSGNGNNGVTNGPVLFPATVELFAKVTNAAGQTIPESLVGFTTTLGNFTKSQATTSYTDNNGVATAFLSQQGNSGQALVKATAYNGNSSLTGNLVAWWPLNLGQGNTAYDLSGNGNAGSMGGVVGWSNPNYVASFDGQTAYVQVPNSTSLDFSGGTALTVSAWFNAAQLQSFAGATGASNPIVDEWQTNNAPFLITLTNNGLPRLLLNAGAAQVEGASPLENNTWYNIVGRYNGTYAALFIDGVQVASSSYSSTLSGKAQLQIGYSSDAGSFLKGDISNVQIYASALSSSQITELYQEGLPGVPVVLGISGWWPLSGNANDYSGNGNNGTVYGNIGFAGSPTASALSGNQTSLLAASFNGVNSNIETGTTGLPTGSSARSVFAWIYGGSPNTYIYSYGTAAAAEMANMEVTTGNVLALEADGYSATGTIPISAGSWHLVGYTYSSGSSQATLYVDGNGQTEPIGSALDTVLSNSTIGAQLGGASNYFSGNIANIQVYNTSLTQSQVQQLYQKGIDSIPISSSTPVAWWPLNGNAQDHSGMGNNGTASNVVYSPQRVAQPLRSTSFFGTGVASDRQGGYISSGTSNLPTGSGARSVFAWAYVADSCSTPNPCSIYYFGTPTGLEDGSLSVYNGNVFFNTSSGSGATGPAVPNGWNFLGYTYQANSDNITFYVNGNSATKTLGGSSVLATVSEYSDIGEASPNHDYFNGSISDVQVYRTDLTASQAEQLYSSQVPPSASASIALGWSP